jgi:hypothetical protein
LCRLWGRLLLKEQPKNSLRTWSKAILTWVTLCARGGHVTSMRIFWML